MNPHELTALHITHVLSVIGLVAATFYACAGAPETRKKTLSWGGLAALLALLTGLRMWQGVYHFHGGWVIVKLVCWLALSMLTGFAYRYRAKARLWIVLTLVFALVALIMVYTQPF